MPAWIADFIDKIAPVRLIGIFNGFQIRHSQKGYELSRIENYLTKYSRITGFLMTDNYFVKLN